jgi:hypothetical protein
VEEVLLESTGRIRFFNKPILRNILVLFGLGCVLALCFISDISKTSLLIILGVFLGVLLSLILSFILETFNQDYKGRLIINNDGLSLFVKTKTHFVARNQICKLIIARPVNKTKANSHGLWGNHIEVINDGNAVSLYLSAVPNESIKKLRSFNIPIVYGNVTWLDEPIGKFFSEMFESMYLFFR